MQYFSDARTAVKLLPVALLAALLLPIGQVSAQQVKDSQINVRICPAPSQSSFTIDEPASDSVVDKSKIVVRGSVQNISQIDFVIDDVYDSTVAIGTADTEYSHSVSVGVGTHTIKLIGYDSCHQANHMKSVVITYQLGGLPSSGSNTTTIVPGSISRGGSGGSNTSSPETVTTEQLEQESGGLIPGLSKIAIPRTIGDINRGLDLDTSFQNDVHSLWRGVSVMLGILFLAAAPVLFQNLMSPLLTQIFKRGGSTGGDTFPVVSSAPHHHIIMRLFGLVLIVVPFLV
ncbi:hypothetical protein CYG49_01840 [Candidatus Saccharibacteria bacterium]|nr:MAG: hypothetical protein CYG49_01840 [Candidatus Saccharibacteria bacterium]